MNSEREEGEGIGEDVGPIGAESALVVNGDEPVRGCSHALGKQKDSNLNAGYLNLGNRGSSGKDEVKDRALTIAGKCLDKLEQIATESGKPAEVLRTFEVTARHTLGTEVTTVDNAAWLRCLAFALDAESIPPDQSERILDRMLKDLNVKGA